METLNLGIDGLDEIEQIGAGGSSRVYRATQVELDRPVALKVLMPSDDPNVARRFDRERKAMGRLSLNEGIVPVYSSGVTDRGEPYLIMPYYPNGSLQDRIAEGSVPWPDAVGYIASATHTMAAAHAAGVVHLDLKPANILLSSTGAPRIADFGIAKLMSEQGATTNTGPAFTPTFSAPEILLGETPSAASDVYGLAATLWALVAGRSPFKAVDGEDSTLMAVVGRVVHQPPDDLRAFAPDSICAVIETGMAKNPALRYPTAGAFGEALSAATEEARKSAPETSLLAVPAAGGAAVASGQAGNARVASGFTEGAGVASGRARTADPNPGGSMLNLAGDGEHGQATNGSASSARPIGSDQGSLRFDAPVPPRLLPAETTRGAVVADTLDRFSGVIVGMTVAAVLLLLAFVGPRLLGGTDNNTSTDATIQLIETNATTSSSQPGALAGAGGSGAEGGEPLGPSLSYTETTAKSATTAKPKTTPAPITPTSAATTESTPTTPTTSETTPTSSATSETTETSTSSSSSSSSSSSTSSSSTSSSTVLAPPLEPPTGVTADYRAGRVVLAWTAPADTDGLTGYTILRNGAPLAANPGAGATRFTDNTLPSTDPGTVYDYAIRANGPAGAGRDSQTSPVVRVKIPGVAPQPGGAGQPDD